MNKDKLKKHHFWILLGLVPLLVLIAVITINSGVGAAIDDKQKEIKKAQDDVAAKRNAKGNRLIESLEKRSAGLANKRTELWESNWNKQFPLFVWPNDRDGLLTRLNYNEKGEGLRFGAKEIPTAQGELDIFRYKEVYLKAYDDMAKRIAPTQFGGGTANMVSSGGGGKGPRGPGVAAGGPFGGIFGGGGGGPKAGEGWQAVLRHVNDWGQQQPSYYQIWLALEDMWVQRAMIECVRNVNETIATFTKKDLTGPDGRVIDSPTHRRFVSRLWDVELEVKEVDGKRVLAGKVTNNTDRLQMLGGDHALVLKVWLDKSAAEPFTFRIGGEFIPGRGTMPIITTEAHRIQPGTTVTEIFQVEQAFDFRTVPVRRVDRLVVGYPDARSAKAPPVKHPLFPEDPVDPATGGPGVPAGPAGGRPAGPGLGAPGPLGGAGPRGEGPGGGATATGLGNGWTVVSGGGPMELVLDSTKKRYLEVTQQVRRLPVAIAVLVDQAYLQDTLTAFANSPLRFQITQVHWNRYRGTINEQSSGGLAGGGEPGTGSSETPLVSAPGQFGTGFEGGGPGPRGGAPVLPFGPRGGGGGPVLPFGPRGGGPGAAGAFGPGSEFPGGFGGGMVSENQLTSGLIDLTIYGVLSLYEKYTPPADPNATTPPPGPTPPPAKP